MGEHAEYVWDQSVAIAGTFDKNSLSCWQNLASAERGESRRLRDVIVANSLEHSRIVGEQMAERINLLAEQEDIISRANVEIQRLRLDNVDMQSELLMLRKENNELQEEVEKWRSDQGAWQKRALDAESIIAQIVIAFNDNGKAPHDMVLHLEVRYALREKEEWKNRAIDAGWTEENEPMQFEGDGVNE